MNFQRTDIVDAYVVEPEPFEDDRGRFARVWCAREFREQGIDVTWVQGNAAESAHVGTLRGLHYQLAPAAEQKLVRCTSGSLYDVVVDARPTSESFRKWFGVVLSAENLHSMFIPAGCAHGYLTLEPNSTIAYLTSAFYAPELERGVNYLDPTLGISWPIPIAVVSDRDRAWPLLPPAGGVA